LVVFQQFHGSLPPTKPEYSAISRLWSATKPRIFWSASMNEVQLAGDVCRATLLAARLHLPTLISQRIRCFALQLSASTRFRETRQGVSRFGGSQSSQVRQFVTVSVGIGYLVQRPRLLNAFHLKGAAGNEADPLAAAGIGHRL